MDNVFHFYLDRKVFGKELRWIRKWYLLVMLSIYVLLAIDGVFLGVHPNLSVKLACAILILPLSIMEAVVWFFAFTYGGTQIFNECTITYNDDGTVDCECKRNSIYPNEKSLVTFKKTIVPKRVIKHNQCWIVFAERRQWIVLPLSVSIEPIKKYLVNK